MVHLLKYGNTNTYFIDDGDGLLIDTDFAGTLPGFFREIKRNGVTLEHMKYVLATHYHPDHCGLLSELTALGLQWILMPNQEAYTHFSDGIFARVPGLHYVPLENERAKNVPFTESRSFLQSIGISGEIFPTGSHSSDGIAVALDSGECFIGDVEPFAYMQGYEKPGKLKEDWDCILSHRPQVLYHAHANTVRLG